VTTPAERLRARLAPELPALASAAERIWTSPSVRELYPVWLGAMHGVARADVPLLHAARARAVELAPVDRLAARLVAYLDRRILDDEGRARLLLEDLEAAGGLPGQVLQATPSSIVASLVGAQYYWIRHRHPVALLGHLAVFEGQPPPSGLAERLRRVTGLPPGAFRVLRRDERAAAASREDVFDLLDELPLEPEHETLLAVSALHAVHGTIAVCDEVRSAIPAVAVVG
jgi:hypothetical protein